MLLLFALLGLDPNMWLANWIYRS